MLPCAVIAVDVMDDTWTPLADTIFPLESNAAPLD
jgi:hypothetical protein